jgi:hypothetical protein
MKNKLLKFFLITLSVLTTGEMFSNSCNIKSEKRHKVNNHCKSGSCGMKNVRQHRFAKSDCSLRKAKSAYKQKENRRMKSCCK